MMFLLPVMFAGALQVGLPSDTPATYLAPSPAWISDSPSSRMKRAFQRTTQRFLVPTLAVGAFHVPSMIFSLLYPPLNNAAKSIGPVNSVRTVAFKVLAWHEPSYAQWRQNALSLPVFPDHDNLIFNFGIHPWVGASIHQAYRRHGVTFLQSVIMVIFWATFWEYVAEASYERPALNDIMANTAGALLGEALFQAKGLIIQQMPPGIPRNVLLAVMDPFGTIETAVLDVADERLGLHPLVQYLR